MIQNNLSVLPWYDNIRRQNHRKDYAYNSVYQLITPAGFILPFHVSRPTRSNEISYIKLISLDSDIATDITAVMKETGLKIAKYENYDSIYYTGLMPINLGKIYDGCYYLIMSDGIDTWYSEVFMLTSFYTDYLRIEWWDEAPILYNGGIIPYNKSAFKNLVYLDTQIGKPEYPYEESGETRDGFFFPDKMISEKVYKFTALVPEYLCDAMRLIRLSDHIIIRANNDEYVCDSFLMTPTWQDQGDLAAIEVEFKVDTVIKKLGLSAAVNRIGGSFDKSYNRDFDADYNNDFEN